MLPGTIPLPRHTETVFKKGRLRLSPDFVREISSPDRRKEGIGAGRDRPCSGTGPSEGFETDPGSRGFADCTEEPDFTPDFGGSGSVGCLAVMAHPADSSCGDLD